MTKKTKAVAKKEKSEVALSDAAKSWDDGMDDDIDAKDILIPKIFVLNPMSGLCVDTPKEFSAGDIIRSTDKKILGDSEKGIDFIPIHDTKVWKVSKKTGSKFEFVRFDPYNHNTADLPWTWEEDGIEWRRDATVNMFCLLPQDIVKEQEAMAEMAKGGDMPDPDDVMLPVCISFSRTSYVASKILITHKAKCRRMKLNMAVKTFTLGCEMKSKDDNKYYVLTVEAKEKTEPSFLDACAEWHNTLKATTVNLDEEGEEASSFMDSEAVSDKF